jgi:hypothetical protein
MAIGNTVAAHVDRDLHQLVASSASMRHRVGAIEGVLPSFRAYIFAVSKCIYEMSISVLAQIDRTT